MSRSNYLVLGTIAVFLTVVWLGSGLSSAQSETPLPPPAMTATAMAPTPTAEPPVSSEAEKALQYISEREGIAIADLLVMNEHPVTYPLLAKSFQLVTILDLRTAEGQEYALLVDLIDGAIEEDIQAIDGAEEEATLEKYGKLHPTLYERLQEVGEDERLPVAIWLTAGPDVTSRSDIFSILVSQYPEAAQAIEEWGEPWAVADTELSREIHEAYYHLRDESVTQRVAAVVTELRDRSGLDVTTYPGMPSVSATLTKQLIESIAARPDVASIYLIEEQGTQTMDTAAWTDRAATVWNAGFDGNGRRIAIVELERISDQVSCLDIASTVYPGVAVHSHPTHVASVAACDSILYSGIAPGSQLVDAGFAAAGNQQENAVQALEQALVNHNADTVVASITFGYDLNIDWIDRAFDYWARDEDVLIAVAIGNEGGNPNLYPGSPATGWNVLTVGGSDDNQTAYWADDDFAEGAGDIDSAYKNPVSNRNDREKPEVVAPAWDITVNSINSFGNPALMLLSGTSVAAPQVGGLTALLLERNGSLAYSAPALRSIIMASALHNVDGLVGIPTGQELKDGAGAIDAAVADQVAQTQGANGGTCNNPCWWNVPTSNQSPPVGGSLNNYFRASRGERIRVAINWWSNADGPGTNYNRDELDTNYNLYVYAPDGTTLLGYSGSYDNNYELVDFVATQTGTYRIRLYRSALDDNSEASNEVGIAWVKDATYLPALHNDGSNDWQSQFVTRHGDSEGHNINQYYFDANGNPTAAWGTGYDTCNLASDARCWIPAWDYNRIPAGTTGSAIVSGGQAGDLVVENLRPGGLTNYTGIASSSGEGWMMPGTSLYVPAFKKAYYGRSGHLEIFNPGASSATVTPRFYEADSGTLTTCSNFNIAPGARRTYHPSDCSSLASNKIYGVRLTATQPLVAVMREDDDATHTKAATVNAFSSGAKKLYVPVVKSNYYGNVSAIIVQNTTGSGTPASVTFYDIDSGSTWNTSYFLPPYATHSFYLPDTVPANQMTSAIVTAGQNIVATAYETKSASGWYMQYNAVVFGGKAVILPRIMKNAGADNWRTGILIQNTNGLRSADVTVRYFTAGGNEVSAAMETFTVGYNESKELYTLNNSALSNGFDGSAVVTSTYPVAVQVNVATDRSGDAAMSYNGIIR